jgi:intracellular septation protein
MRGCSYTLVVSTRGSAMRRKHSKWQMHQLFELVPIILFFTAYQMDGKTLTLGEYSHQFDGIFTATAVLMIATALQVLITWLIKRKVEKKLWWTLLAIMIFGAATLILRNQLFIQWKPTIFNWGLAIALIAAQVFSGKNLLERMLGEQVELPHVIWARLNMAWIINFVVVGALNLYVAYTFSESVWVSYKLYSAIGFTLLLMVITMIIIVPHIKDNSTTK